MSKTLSLTKRAGDSTGKTAKSADQRATRAPIRGRNRNNHTVGVAPSTAAPSARPSKPSGGASVSSKRDDSKRSSPRPSQSTEARGARSTGALRRSDSADARGERSHSARSADGSARASFGAKNSGAKTSAGKSTTAKPSQTVLRHGKVRDGVREFADGRVVRAQGSGKPSTASSTRPASAASRPRNPNLELKSLRDERASAPSADNGIRISKYLADQGLCSRREADAYIEKGWVTVNGKRAELGQRVLPHERVQLARQASAAQALRVTILINKPVGYVSGQAEDGYAPAVSLITAENQWVDAPFQQDFEFKHLRGLAPAGRLDIDSVGLLVLTQDGRVAKQLIGEDSEIDKEYLVRVEGELIENGLQLLNHGLELDGVPLRRAQVSWQNEDQLRFVLREGKKRQIRRMCELVGLKVVGLKRIRIGKVKLGNLPTGQWRYLAEDEVF